ncbi:InlB B-repeat-containing protein, partial [Enterococcus ureasiticus]
MKKSVYLLLLLVCWVCGISEIGTVKAEAEGVGHIVTFAPDNDTSYPDWFKTEVEDGGLVTERPEDPEKAGYKFIGWYHTLDNEDQPIYWNFEKDQVTDNTTLWAAYVKKHIVTFDPDNDTNYSDWFKTEVEDGGLVTERPEDPEKAGYKFIGWYHTLDSEDQPIYWDFEKDRVADNTTLWAAYVKKHIVTFDPDNDTNYSDWFKTEVEDGGLVTERPEDP